MTTYYPPGWSPWLDTPPALLPLTPVQLAEREQDMAAMVGESAAEGDLGSLAVEGQVLAGLAAQLIKEGMRAP
jgi:hypothetical protein